jgi:ornithine carbamoyltransferase
MLALRASTRAARLVRFQTTAAAAASNAAADSVAPRPPRDNKPRFQKRGNSSAQSDTASERTGDRPSQRERTKKTLARRTHAPHLLTLADLSVAEIEGLVHNALSLKLLSKTYGPQSVRKSLSDRSVALMFSKRSTRTRVASESSVTTLGGNSMFLGSNDIQLGVNESLRDTATVVGSMVDGIMARVNGHDEVETLAQHSPVPVINALSDLYHPTQILADLLTLVEVYAGDIAVPAEVQNAEGPLGQNVRQYVKDNFPLEKVLKGKKMAWVGDTNNMTNEFLVVMPRFGMTLGVAAPKGYDTVDPRVWKRV